MIPLKRPYPTKHILEALEKHDAATPNRDAKQYILRDNLAPDIQAEHPDPKYFMALWKLPTAEKDVFETFGVNLEHLVLHRIEYNSFRAQFPGLADEIEKCDLQPWHESNQLLNKFTCDVVEADGDLMYRCGHNVGVYGDYGFIISSDPARQGQIKRRGDHLFALGKNGNVLRWINWSQDESQQARSALFGHSGCFIDGVACLAWVSVEAWCDNSDPLPRNEYNPILERNIYVTIHNRPACGWMNLMDQSIIDDRLVLDSPIVRHGIRKQDFDIIRLYGALEGFKSHW